MDGVGAWGERCADGFGWKRRLQVGDRPVAIKVPLAKRIGRPADIEAYLAEARTLAALSHPHIISVYDIGRTEDGSFFVVSKFIEGSDLARLLRTSPPNNPDAAHRDVKPANILIDRSGSPILADFGLALRDVDFGKGGRSRWHPRLHEPRAGEGRRPPR